MCWLYTVHGLNTLQETKHTIVRDELPSCLTKRLSPCCVCPSVCLCLLASALPVCLFVCSSVCSGPVLSWQSLCLWTFASCLSNHHSARLAVCQVACRSSSSWGSNVPVLQKLMIQIWFLFDPFLIPRIGWQRLQNYMKTIFLSDKSQEGSGTFSKMFHLQFLKSSNSWMYWNVSMNKGN